MAVLRLEAATAAAWNLALYFLILGCKSRSTAASINGAAAGPMSSTFSTTACFFSTSLPVREFSQQLIDLRPLVGRERWPRLFFRFIARLRKNGREAKHHQSNNTEAGQQAHLYDSIMTELS